MPATFVYCLATPDWTRSYVGVTSNVRRRLRQHRGEIEGGAEATRKIPCRADWQLVCELRGFASRQHARQWEARWHRGGVPRFKALAKTAVPLKRRLLHLAKTRALLRVNDTAPTTDEYPIALQWAEEEYYELFVQAKSMLH